MPSAPRYTATSLMKAKPTPIFEIWARVVKAALISARLLSERFFATLLAGCMNRTDDNRSYSIYVLLLHSVPNWQTNQALTFNSGADILAMKTTKP
ncbi:hypothetical protein D3C81_1915130 [compost metagenome]